MSRLLELVMRLAVEMQERASSDYDFAGRSLEQLSDAELLQILIVPDPNGHGESD